jgi:dTMP kinase
MSFFGAKVIVFEGVDGCGKSTQIKLLSKYLDKLSIKHHCTREPGGSPIAEKIRKLFLSIKELDIYSQLLLCSAARNEHLIYLEELQKKEKFEFIIFDRFSDSTLAYQIYPYGLSEHLFSLINKELVLNIDIDCEFILDIDPLISKNRRKAPLDHFDENTEFLNKVRQHYLEIQKKKKKRVLLNTDHYPKFINFKIIRHLEKRFPSILKKKNPC